MSEKLKIAFVSSEVIPFAKTGGLADVAGTLPKELEKAGHDVRVIMPFYTCIKKANIPVFETGISFFIPLGDKSIKAEIFSATIAKDVTIYFVRNDDFFYRDGLYGTNQGDYPDNSHRFIFFQKAVLELLPEVGFKPDIIHCNDWQTGLIPVFIRVMKKDTPFYKDVKTVFTIHNIAYQGIYWSIDMNVTGLSWSIFNPEGIEYYGNINCLKAGIVYSDAVTTVSKRYSQEIQTSEFGYGLEGVLKSKAKKLFGILNGVDYTVWNPETDEHIAFHFNHQETLGKVKCKLDLIKQYKLPIQQNIPVIGIISRLTDQKGFDILSEALKDLMKLKLALVVLGSGEKKYEELFTAMAKKYPAKIGVKIEFNETLAHKIEAGSDFFLMPSKFEPCGLNQIYSLKYGTVPIVRSTGGLDDTIDDFDQVSGDGNGFKFYEYNARALTAKVKEAIAVYRKPKLFKRLMVNAMGACFSWKESAGQYTELYGKLMKGKIKSNSGK